MNTILITNAHIVNDDHVFVGTVRVEGDQITHVIEGEAKDLVADQTIDARGQYLLPGIIDTHVHFREPGMTHKADMDTESRAALAGGVTTVLDMPNVNPVTATRATLRERFDIAADKCRCNYGFYFGATAENADMLSTMTDDGVCGIKLFMGSSTGNLLVEDEAALRTIFAESRLPIVVHCEDTRTINANMATCKAQYGPDPDVRFHPEIRSEEACYRSTETAVRMAREAGARLHVAHITTARELDLFDPADHQITAEVCLPHLIFTDADYARRGARIKCNPAIKTAADRAALRRALTDGRVYTVGTDHAPHQLSEKQGGVVRAMSGMPGVQFSLVAMLGLVDQGELDIARLVRLMCHNPAETFGILRRGYIRPGYKADLVLVAPKAPWTLTPNKILSKCGWSPFEGFTFSWQVRKTWCNGYLIYNNGVITDNDFHGERLTFKR